MFAGTVYAFAIILAVFLIGMAAGSFMAAFVLRLVRPPPGAGDQSVAAGGRHRLGGLY